MVIKYVRIKDTYYEDEMRGAEGVILRGDTEDVLLGFPLNSPFGWYDPGESTEYKCWWISEDYLEHITTITRSEFK
jgi:hypothetical protein